MCRDAGQEVWRGFAPTYRARLFDAQGRKEESERSARKVLRDAVAGFGSLGAEAWRAQAERELDGTGGAVTRRAIHAGPADDRWSALASLTPRERPVAAAVARGTSNREIATMLFVSPKTVETHLTRIHAELGAASCPQLVALLARVLHQRGPKALNPRIGDNDDLT